MPSRAADRRWGCSLYRRLTIPHLRHKQSETIPRSAHRGNSRPSEGTGTDSGHRSFRAPGMPRRAGAIHGHERLAMQIYEAARSGNRRNYVEPLTRVQGDSKTILTTSPVWEREVLGTKRSLMAGYLPRCYTPPLRRERVVARLNREPVCSLSDIGRHGRMVLVDGSLGTLTYGERVRRDRFEILGHDGTRNATRVIIESQVECRDVWPGSIVVVVLTPPHGFKDGRRRRRVEVVCDFGFEPKDTNDL